MFTCATPETGLTSFTLTPGIALGNTMEMILPNGDRQLTLSFIALLEYQMLLISCVATRLNSMGMVVDVNSSTAVLMIQGETSFNSSYKTASPCMVSHNYCIVCFLLMFDSFVYKHDLFN